nr:LOW QUALITY PROTEIN: uncharacterized protein LOC123003170 [Drosophila takahashii]
MDTRFLFVYILIGTLLINGIRAARKWEYEPLSVTSTTSNETFSLVKIQIVRIRRGEYAISANVKWDYDTTDETMVEAYAFHSVSGDANEYKVLPWSIPKQPFYHYLNTYYKDVIIGNCAHCSNIPVFKDKFEPPWPKKTYIGEKCVMNGDGFHYKC